MCSSDVLPALMDLSNFVHVPNTRAPQQRIPSTISSGQINEITQNRAAWSVFPSVDVSEFEVSSKANMRAYERKYTDTKHAKLVKLAHKHTHAHPHSTNWTCHTPVTQMHTHLSFSSEFSVGLNVERSADGGDWHREHEWSFSPNCSNVTSSNSPEHRNEPKTWPVRWSALRPRKQVELWAVKGDCCLIVSIDVGIEEEERKEKENGCEEENSNIWNDGYKTWTLNRKKKELLTKTRGRGRCLELRWCWKKTMGELQKQLQEKEVFLDTEWNELIIEIDLREKGDRHISRMWWTRCRVIYYWKELTWNHNETDTL